MKKILLDYLTSTRDRKKISYEELRLRIDCAKSVSTLQRIFTGQVEPTVSDLELIIEKGLQEDPRIFYSQIGKQEFADSEQIDYKGAKELLADFAAEKEAMRQEFADRLAHAKEMRISEQTAFKAALDALEADHDYLTAGGVFPEELLKNFIAAKREECRQMAAIPHSAEFDKYYNL